MTRVKKILCVFNFPSHYRENIYLKMEKQLKCDFIFGNIDIEKIKLIEKNKFKKPYKILKSISLFNKIYFLKGIFKYPFKNYNTYILTGDYYCISVWYLLVFNKLLGKKTFLWTHGWYGNENFIKSLIKKLFFNLSDGIFLYGNYAKDLMIKKGFKNHKLHVIFNSLDYEKQISIRKSLIKNEIFKDYFKNSNKNITFIGRLNKIKKLNQLLLAQKQLSYLGVNFNVTLIGDGNDKFKLQSQVRKLGLEKFVWFYGSCYNQFEIGNLLFNSDLCVSPGNVGLTAIHSLTFGTPVITHNNYKNQMPEFESIIENVTGNFFEEGDISDLVNSILKTFELIDAGIINKENCFKIIDSKFNPNFQIKVFKNALL